jgi:hypothetical protein
MVAVEELCRRLFTTAAGRIQRKFLGHWVKIAASVDGARWILAVGGTAVAVEIGPFLACPGSTKSFLGLAVDVADAGSHLILTASVGATEAG